MEGKHFVFLLAKIFWKKCLTQKGMFKTMIFSQFLGSSHFLQVFFKTHWQVFGWDVDLEFLEKTMRIYDGTHRFCF